MFAMARYGGFIRILDSSHIGEIKIETFHGVHFWTACSSNGHLGVGILLKVSATQKILPRYLEMTEGTNKNFYNSI